MSQHDHTMSIWPTPPANHQYAEFSNPGNNYITTGYFPSEVIGDNGKGRALENCARVTSLFFDVDCVGLLDALRVAAGEELEEKVKDRKAVLYVQSSEEVQQMKDTIMEIGIDSLSMVFGMDPTLVIDSGWGLHFHYAYTGTAPASFLQSQMKAIIGHLNEKVRAHCAERCGIHWAKAFDATHDVGVRLARFPGEVNGKCAAQPKVVTILIDNLEVSIDDAALTLIVANLPEVEEDFCSHEPKPAKSVKPPKVAPAGGVAPLFVNFSSMTLKDGRTWAAVTSMMGPDERINVTCPFQGTSIGSAFFAKDSLGRARFVSNATGNTYYDTAAAGSGTVPPPPPSNTPPDAAAPPPAAPVEPGARVFANIPVAYQRTLQTRQGGQVILTPMGPQRPEPMALCLNLILAEDSMFDFWYDEFRCKLMNGADAVTDEAYMQVLLILEVDYDWRRQRPTKDMVWAAIGYIAQLHKRNPVKEYLTSLTWDGQPRLDDWIDTAVMQPGRDAGIDIPVSDLIRTYGRKWTISLVARAMQPGCKVDTVLVLHGGQGAGKSTLYKAWVPEPDLVVDTPLQVDSKDRFMTLAAAWIYEDAEMSSGTRAQEESKKAFLSSASDTYRLPYAHTTSRTPRHCVIVGSTNDQDLLKDHTGSRRYWVVGCPQIAHLSDADERQPLINSAWIVEHRDQLLAEAVVAFQAGEQWWLSRSEDAERAENNAKHTHKDEWSEAAERVFEANCGGLTNAFSAKSFARAVDAELKPDAIAKLGFLLSRVLTAAGFRKAPAKVKGCTLYYKAVPDSVVPLANNGLAAARDEVAGNWRFDHGSFRK